MFTILYYIETDDPSYGQFTLLTLSNSIYKTIEEATSKCFEMCRTLEEKNPDKNYVIYKIYPVTTTANSWIMDIDPDKNTTMRDQNNDFKTFKL